MIRTATFDDLDALVDLARLYHQEAHGWLPFDESYVRDNFRLRTIDTVDGICRVIDDGTGPEGFLAGVVTRLFVAPVSVAVELSWYVRPDARGRGGEMIDDFERWGLSKGCVGCSLSMNDFPDDPRRTEAMIRLYARKGYRSYERAFLKLF